MNDHDHVRPDPAVLRAVLGVARAVLDAEPDRAVAEAAAARCPVCLAVGASQFGFALCTSIEGEPFMSGPLRARLLAAIDVAERELGSAPN